MIIIVDASLCGCWSLCFDSAISCSSFSSSIVASPLSIRRLLVRSCQVISENTGWRLEHRCIAWLHCAAVAVAWWWQSLDLWHCCGTCGHPRCFWGIAQRRKIRCPKYVRYLYLCLWCLSPYESIWVLVGTNIRLNRFKLVRFVVSDHDHVLVLQVKDGLQTVSDVHWVV